MSSTYLNIYTSRGSTRALILASPGKGYVMLRQYLVFYLICCECTYTDKPANPETCLRGCCCRPEWCCAALERPAEGRVHALFALGCVLVLCVAWVCVFALLLCACVFWSVLCCVLVISPVLSSPLLSCPLLSSPLLSSPLLSSPLLSYGSTLRLMMTCVQRVPA